MGITVPIPAGRHFPTYDGPPPQPREVLGQAPVIERSHPSFRAADDAGEQPALEKLRELIEAGFGRLYSSRAEAETALGGPCFPAPLGDVVKLGPNGVAKHRLIQDLRRNGVNACAEIPERQVLPRFVDHAVDLAVASAEAARSGNSAFETLVLDYENAFMSVAVAPAEARFNCCLLEEPLTRTRAALDDDEPLTGLFVVWLVLGFGGKSYPLLYARVALECT